MFALGGPGGLSGCCLGLGIVCSFRWRDFQTVFRYLECSIPVLLRNAGRESREHSIVKLDKLSPLVLPVLHAGEFPKPVRPSPEACDESMTCEESAYHSCLLLKV